MSINEEGLAKVVAIVLWADEKVTEEEWSEAEGIFKKFGISWADAKRKLEGHIEDLLKPGDEDEAVEETDEDFDIENVYLGEVDNFEILCDLASLLVADKEVTFTEIDILHRIARAIETQPELASAALIKAVTGTNCNVNLD